MTTWRKSTYSGPSAGCVEVARWRSSTRCVGHDAGNCIEIQEYMSGDGILVRDSKDPDGPRLAFTRIKFARLLARIKEANDG